MFMHLGSSIKDVRSERGRGLAQRPQFSIAQRLAVFLVTPTVTAVAVLNGPLRSLDVCCLWLPGLWHEAHASVKR